MKLNLYFVYLVFQYIMNDKYILVIITLTIFSMGTKTCRKIMHLGDILPLLFQILSLNIGTSTYRVFHNENGIKMKDSVHLSFFKANSEINEIF